jgi:hypothetical protein
VRRSGVGVVGFLDLIERLCIEAALRITHDNRASAAEMLGLSRQGFYATPRASVKRTLHFWPCRHASVRRSGVGVVGFLGAVVKSA